MISFRLQQICRCYVGERSAPGPCQTVAVHTHGSQGLSSWSRSPLICTEKTAIFSSRSGKHRHRNTVHPETCTHRQVHTHTLPPTMLYAETPEHLYTCIFHAITLKCTNTQEHIHKSMLTTHTPTHTNTHFTANEYTHSLNSKCTQTRQI